MLFPQVSDDDGNPAKFFRTAHKCDAFSYCIFASEAIIQNINLNIDPERRHYLLDASFKVCPLGEFNHFLIIHIEYMETVNGFKQNTFVQK